MLRTLRALSYKYLVHFSIWTKCLSDDVEMLTPQLRTSFWRTSWTIRTWSSKNYFHNSLFRMKCECTALILRHNNKAYNVTNESVKIVISLHCI